MKYCVSYHRGSNFRYLDQVDEIEVPYRREDLTLPAFLEEHSNQTIILTLVDLNGFLDRNDIERLAALRDKYKNFKVRFNYLTKEILAQFEGSQIPYFFSNLISDWEVLIGVLTLHPTDIYISHDLCFDLKRVADLVHYHNVQLRVYPNIAQSRWEKTSDLKKFFIRPEDVDLYDNYIDVIEFYTTEKQLSVYYEIYAINKRWFGPLKECIIGLNSDVDNRCIMPGFGEHRIKCQKRCFKRENGCNICERIADTSYLLEQKKLMYITKKDKKKDEE